ncbi:hypothetical protein PUV54_01835 [Hyphococcus flavus]|uniref:Lipoprotein n=1 Tax=Hyphococcus flavus TaxID=1866326 RepID=A0AAE9ZBW0_9PROT|nr:hypothetical protein [Hyphococcus flavus]WDI31928.1 hypothetical protein PUV54_01835 [Hyphococcus flavus]
MKTTKRTFSLGSALIAVIAAAGVTGCSESQKYPQSIEIAARPGAALVVPFKQRVKGAPKRALGAIEASPLIDPNPLPQGAELLDSSLYLFGSGDVGGDVLIYVPETASGAFTFSLAASGDGRGQSASAVFFKTEATDVTVQIAGAPVENAPSSDLAGPWTRDDEVWTFEDGVIPSLRILYPSGEEKVMRYAAYPDGAGRWFLIDYDPAGATYWASLEGDTLLLAHPDAQFEPFATLARQ